MKLPNEEHMVQAGDILVARGTILPEPLTLAGDASIADASTASDGSIAADWVRVAGNPDRHQLEEQITAAGWKFFYLAIPIQTTAYGFNQQRTTRTAMERLTKAVGLRNFNSVEIDTVEHRSFCGLPSTRISAHPRHIQKSGVLSGRSSWDRSGPRESQRGKSQRGKSQRGESQHGESRPSERPLGETA